MATISSTIREGVGDMLLHVVSFSDLDDTDTYVSGLQGIVTWWATATDNPSTQTNNALDVSESSGTFTFNSGENDRVAKLVILTTQPE